MTTANLPAVRATHPVPVRRATVTLVPLAPATTTPNAPTVAPSAHPWQFPAASIPTFGMALFALLGGRPDVGLFLGTFGLLLLVVYGAKLAGRRAS